MAELALSARHLHVALAGRPILHDVSLEARRGEVLAVLGPNGAGKSTLLRALMGLVPSVGEIHIDGVPEASLSAERRARLVSFVPQQSALRAALPVREVVALGRYAQRAGLSLGGVHREAAQAVDDALRETDVLALAERPFSDLSSGEQKRVLLARALCTGASTLLLDEPTATLDIAHALHLLTALRTLSRTGRTVVLVLHQLEHALDFADRALLLERGRVRASGPTREVVTPENVRALYGVELIERGAPAFRLPGRAP